MGKQNPPKQATRGHEPHTSVEEFERALRKHLPSIFEPTPEGLQGGEKLKKLEPIPISDEEMDVLENYEAPDHLDRILETLHQKGLNPEEELPPDLLERYHNRSESIGPQTERPKLPPQARPKPDLVAPEDIVSAFGQVLADSAPMPGSVADENELPYPKHEIKWAILILLATTIEPKMREHLLFAYISLADWQIGVGQVHQGMPNLLNRDPGLSVSDFAKQIASNADAYEPWKPIVKAEQQLLLAELQRLGY